MNYAALTQAIEDYTENYETSFIANIPVFVQQAEQRIYNTVQFPSLRKNMTGTVTATTPYLSAPSDYLSTYSLAVIDADGNYEYLLNKDVNFIREAYPKNNLAARGRPKHYANFDDSAFILGPTPDLAYSAELHYGYYPESIVTAGTTWLGNEFDSALLNGALVEAIRFMKGEQDMVALYERLYVQAIGLLKNLGDGKLRQDAYRSGQVRIPVS